MLSRVIARLRRLDRARSGQLLVACGLVIGLTLAVTFGFYAVTSRQAAIDDALREMRNDALLLADQEDRLLLAIDLVQRGMIKHMRELGIDSPASFEQLMNNRLVHDNLREQIAALPQLAALSLVTRDGQLLNVSRTWPPPAVSDSRRDFIGGLAARGSGLSFISEPTLDRTTGKWTIYLSHRFEAPDGQLIGFVIGTLQLDYFEQFFAHLPLTGGGSFALYRNDGLLLARYPRIDPNTGKRFAAVMNFRRIVDALNDGAVRVTSVLDGQDRLIVPHAMANFPLIVTVSDTMESVLRSWRKEIRVLVVTTVALELMITGTMLLGVRHLRNRERLLAAETARMQAEAELALAEERSRAAETLHQQQLRFDSAVQDLPQGLIMLDDAGKVLAINRTFCEIAGVAMEELPLGTSYQKLIDLIFAAGVATREDLHDLRQRREAMTRVNDRTTFVWEPADGRSFNVTHQRLEEGWLTTYEDITDQRAAQARIAHLARHDALTGLPNRVLFRETLDSALTLARRGHLVALHCLDLDEFKAVNDTLGHPVGDQLLRKAAQRLHDGLRDTDAVARLGGDEFAVVQTMITAPHDATALAGRLIKLIEQPFEIDGHQILVGVSIGIAFAPADTLDPDQMLKCADLAMYRAKQDGRGIYRLFQAEMDAAMQARHALEMELRQALPSGQLELFFQPQVDVQARRISGCEALLRWRHPGMGLVSPDRFIDLAEATGMIVPIGDWVLNRACAAAAAWPKPLKVAVNVSAVQFRSHDLIRDVVAALRVSGLPANRLELEITESVMLQDTDATLATLRQLRALGVQIAMDDFGTGYSSLSYLRRFPLDRIKIDKCFIRELVNQEDCRAIVRAVIALGRDLGMEITAEGVETTQQLETLELSGCSEIQGFLFSRPVPEAAVAELLQSMSGFPQAWGEATPLLLPLPVNRPLLPTRPILTAANG